MSTQRTAALDGLRGCAVLLVVAFHAGLPGFGGGFLGVSMFFTLSGFLITRLLLQEHAEHGSIALGAFWGRRSRRLLPAALVCLTVVAALADGLGRELSAAVLYVANWQQVAAQSDYTALFDTHPVLAHFWSLAVEEQFYIVWPLVVWVALRRFGHQRGPVVALVFGAAVGALGYLGAIGDPQRVYLGTDTRAVEILVGAALAVALDRPRTAAMLRRHVRRVIPAAALLAMLFTVAASTTGSAWVYHGGLILFAVGSAALLAGIVHGGPVSRVFELSWLRGCGKISYGLYLYHWPAFVLIGTESVGSLALSLAVAFGTSVLSYVVVEMPVRSGRVRAGVLFPALAIVSVALVAIPGRSGAVASEDVFEGKSTGCYYGDSCAPTDLSTITSTGAPGVDRPLRILVFGDSVAQVTAWSLTNSSAAGEGRIEVISMGVGACPLVGDSYRWDRTSNGKWTKYCDIDAVLAAIAKYQPDAVLAVFTLANQADVRIAGTWTSLDDPVMRAVMLSRMEDVAEAVNEADSVLLWSSAPRGVDVRELFAMADRRVAVHNQMVDEFLRTHPAVSRFPLAEQYAELDAGAFRDGIHLDKAAAVAQAEDWQVEHILAAIDERGSTSPGSDGTTDDR
jgi:peptidoglycan/LPS O-acetylase OafA/YrhL